MRISMILLLRGPIMLWKTNKNGTPQYGVPRDKSKKPSKEKVNWISFQKWKSDIAEQERPALQL